MHMIPFLNDFLVILSAAIVVILVAHRIHVPVVVGFLLTGLLIGPHSLALVPNQEQVEVLAEIGVVILLFTIGLEFSLERLNQIRRTFLLGGSLQALITSLAVVGLSTLFGFSLGESIFIGFLITLSSTAIVLKLYDQRREIDAPQGKLVIGILLFQDFLIVLMIVLVPVLAGTVEASISSVLLRLGEGIIVVGVVFVAARFLMPKVLRAIVALRIREVFVLGAVVACLGFAFLTAAMDFSFALGAFLAGIIISESEYSHQVVAEMMPFRDVFNSIFFISIGMLLNLQYAAANMSIVLLLGVAILSIKALVVLAIVLMMKYPLRISVLVAVSIAQIGEFSFVLMKVGQSNGLLSDGLYQSFLASSILTMMVTPFLIRSGPAIAGYILKVMPWKSRTETEGELTPEEIRRDHVIIVGYGLNGRNLTRVLKETGIQYVVIELNGETVRKARRVGQPIFYGDVTRKDILRLCAIETASTIVFAISDPKATMDGVRLARSMNPSIHIIVRTRTITELDALYKAGANEVIPEEFETSIEIFTRVLSRFHIPRNIIAAQERFIRGEGYRVLRTPARQQVVSEKMMHWLAAGTTEVFLVEEGGKAAGKTVLALDLHGKTGVNVIAIVRGEKSTTNPSPDFRIDPGDALVLVGNHAEIERAFVLLEFGTEVSKGTGD